MRHHLVIDIATSEKGANYLGMVSSIPPEDLFTRWRSDYEADVMVSLASLVGERMFFEGSGWLLGKLLLCAMGIGLIAYHRGRRPKHSNRDISDSITSTILWSTLFVLTVHFVFAFLEF